MKKLAVLLLLVSVSAFGYCNFFYLNTNDCIMKETDDWPIYSDGTPLKEGGTICIGHVKEVEKIEFKKQGIPIELNGYRAACRVIESIKLRFHGDRECCSRNYTVGTGAYRYCLEAEQGPCATKSYYLTHFSRDLIEDVGFQDEASTWQLKDDPNFVLIGDSIDVFRDDGTLKYRGFLSITRNAYESNGAKITEPVKTSGFCYDKKGKQTKRVNNVDACK